MKRLFGALLVALPVGSGVATGQVLVGTVAGTVVDELGARLPGVTITLSGNTGGQVAISDAVGEYRFVGLSPGTYRLNADLPGFRLLQEQSVDLGVGQTLQVHLVMAVAGVSENVDVIAPASSVDTTTTKTDTNLSQQYMFSLPISHANPGSYLLNYAPGVNEGAAFGGAAYSSNALLLDGVDTRDPQSGTAWTFFDYNLIQEVQLGNLGQPAEYGGFTGVVVNTITKSGSNRYSALAEYRYTSDRLASNNVTDEIVEQNATLAAPVKVLKLTDFTAQLGGPIKRDRVFFFGNVQWSSVDQYVPPARSDTTPRFTIKMTNQLTPRDSLVASAQYDRYDGSGRVGLIPGYAIGDPAQTCDQRSPEAIWNAQYRKVFAASSLLEVRYTGWWGYSDLYPVTPEPAHFDGATSSYSGGAGLWARNDRTRNQINAAISTYANAFGEHNFKFGMELERSTVRDRSGYSGASAEVPTGVFYYDYGGPYIAYGYSYDLQGTTRRESFYAQDQWKRGRLTATAGVRLDRIVGGAHASGEDMYSTTSIGPRLGAAFDLTGSGKSVARAFWGRMYDGAVFWSWRRAVPGLTPTTYYEVGPEWSRLTPFDEVERKYRVSDGLDHPRVDEFSFAIEHQLRGPLKISATGVFREWNNFLNSVLMGAAWTPFAFPNTKTTEPMTLYGWANPTKVPEFVIENTDRVTYLLANGESLRAPEAHRSYRGLLLIVQKRLKDRWQAQLSYVLSKTTGNIQNTPWGGIASGQFETPNTILVNVGGPTAYDRRHEVKLGWSYQVPRIEVLVGGFWRYLSGTPYAPTTRMPARRLNWTQAVNVNLESPGSYWNDNQTNLDLRVEKVLNLGIHRFGLYADVYNVFNTAVVTNRVSRYPMETLTDPTTGESLVVPFGSPRNMNAGRQVTLGGRWSF